MLTRRSFDLFDVMDRLFHESWPGYQHDRFFGLETEEKNGMWHARLEVPGFAAEDISIEVDGKSLRISGKKEVKSEGTSFGRQTSSFQESLYLGKKVDLEKITASVKDGVLIISAPLLQDTKTLPQKVEVKQG